MTSNAAVLPSHRALVAKLAQRPVISVNRLLLATTAYLAATQNGALWGLVRRTLPAEPSLADGSLILALVSILLAGTFTTLALLSPRPVIKPALGLLVVTAVVCNYFMTRYGVVIDTHMWVNVQHTNEREASELLSAGLLRQLLLWAAVPMLLLWRVQVSSQAWGAEWGTRLLYLLIVWAVALTAVGLQYKHVSIWLRTHSEIAKYPNPFYPVGSAIKFAYRGLIAQASAGQFTLVGEDAVARETTGRPRRVVLVVGETARADHFALNGYARNTNPRMAALTGLVNFPHVSSCGTATAMSVPCMFSEAGRADFNREAAGDSDNLLDVIQRAEIDVLWRETNTGCQGVCVRVAVEDLSLQSDQQGCRDGECMDEKLLSRLEQVFERTPGDQLVVLHLLGSHGPAYYRRYPAAFRQFEPECRLDDAYRCDTDALVNSYDNSLLYTDHVLGELVARLEQHGDTHDTAMIYLSDHGESLGEHGVFLHGFPYKIAPSAQTEVPMLAWISPSMQSALALDMNCLETTRQQAYSHDDLFASILGLFDVQTGVYRADADVFAGCRDAS